MPGVNEQMPESATHAGATDMARRVQEYWHRRGKTQVKVWIEPLSETRRNYWIIRSNIAMVAR